MTVRQAIGKHRVEGGVQTRLHGLGGARVWATGVAIALCLLLTACDYATSASGRVQTEAGEPIEEASVQLEVGSGMPRVTQTDAEGAFEIAAMHGYARRAALRVGKEGFPERVVSLDSSEDNPDLVIELGAEPPPQPAAAGIPLSFGIPLGLVIAVLAGLLYLRRGRQRTWLVLATLGLLMAAGTVLLVVLAARSMP